MLTRLEVNGFKNLLAFSVDFGPFTCIAGPNSVGKSNIFDAVHLLSLLADHTIMEAALLVRDADPETTDLRDLFWTNGRRRSDELSIAAEMLIDPEVKDDFGRPAEATSTYLRYEIEIGYEAPKHRGSLGRLVLLAERLKYIKEESAVQSLRFPHSAREFREAVVRNRRRARSGYISSEKARDGQIEILVHQDGGRSGKPQRASGATAPRTIVATSNTSATPTILAARREMQGWRRLALEPSAMRRADHFHDDPRIAANGAHLAATLHRLASDFQGTKSDGEKVYARVAARLADLVPVADVKVDVDDVRQLLTLKVQETSGVELPASSLSDGTLRFLVLCVLREDRTHRGLMCMEEPENGIYPGRMEAMVSLLRELTVNPMEAPGSENPLRQVIVATHSPAFVQLQTRDDLLLATEATVKGPDLKPARTVRCRPLDNTWRSKGGEPSVGLGTILSYLTDYPGTQLRLPSSQIVA